MPHKSSSQKNSRFKAVLQRVFFYGALGGIITLAGMYWHSLYKKTSGPAPDTKAPIISTGTLGEMPLYAALKKAGLTEPLLSKISIAAEKLIPAKELRAADTYTITLDNSGRFMRATVTHGLTLGYVAATTTGAIKSGKTEIPVISNALTASGTIKNSLWNSMAEQGLSPQIIMEFADAFSWNIDFLTETRDGDTFALAFERRQTNDGRIVGREILAACYNGKETGLKKAFAYKGAYYDEKGAALERMFLRAPLTYRRISSYFSNRRFHPVLRIFRAHHGIDYAAPTGTPVSAVARGRVIYKGWRGGFGNYVEIKHDFGYVTSYGHLSRYAKNLKKGMTVKQGDLIAYVGSTGLSSGPHLDFRIKQNNSYFNFLKMKNRSSRGLSGGELAAYKNLMLPLEARLEAELNKLNSTDTK